MDAAAAGALIAEWFMTVPVERPKALRQSATGKWEKVQA